MKVVEYALRRRGKLFVDIDNTARASVRIGVLDTTPELKCSSHNAPASLDESISTCWCGW